MNANNVDELTSTRAELAASRALATALQVKLDAATLASAKEKQRLERLLEAEKGKPFSKSVLDRLTAERNILHETVSGCEGCKAKVIAHGNPPEPRA